MDTQRTRIFGPMGSAQGTKTPTYYPYFRPLQASS